ncbi:DNA mismatch repair protein MSH5, partial [Phenoliferia sp. Uapishka_3]
MDRLQSFFSNEGGSRRNPSPAGSHSSRQTATPQFSPAPSDIQADLRKVRWGSNDVFDIAKEDPYASDDDMGDGGSDAGDGDNELEGPSAWTHGITLAITATRGKLGCAYYDGDRNKLLFLEDSEDSSLEQWDLVNDGRLPHLRRVALIKLTRSHPAQVVQQLNPTTVISPASADPTFLTALQAYLAALSPSSSSSQSSTSSAHPINLEFRPGREFNAGSGRAALSQVIVREGGIYALQEADAEGDDDTVMSETGRRNAYSMGGGGKRNGFQNDRSRRNGELRLESFISGLASSPLTVWRQSLWRKSYISLQTLYRLSSPFGLRPPTPTTDSMRHRSLQIFSPESHASIHSNKTKEGLSLFGIMNTARSPLGRALLRKWFLRPPLVLETIQARHTAVECFLRHENRSFQPSFFHRKWRALTRRAGKIEYVAEAIQTNFRFIKNIPKTLRILAEGKGAVRDWQAVYQFTYGAIMIRDSLATMSHRHHVDVIKRFLASFDNEGIGELGRMINDIVDWEESNMQKRVCVKSGVYSDLDELRRQYHGLTSLLSRIADDISTDIPPDLATSLSVVYFPQLGYLITIPFESKGSTSPPQWDDWQYQFVTEEFAYYKSDKCRDLDEHLGDIHSFISDKEIEIMHALLVKVVAQQEAILAVSSCLSELDWSAQYFASRSVETLTYCRSLLAFAETAKIYDWNRPTMSEDNTTEIKEGRHPLVELCVDSFVTNDTILAGSKGVSWDFVAPELGGGEDDKASDAELESEIGKRDENSMIIITGANYSGKSIYLKQIALITFMAHLGRLPLPLVDFEVLLTPYAGSYVPAAGALIGLTDRILVRIATVESITRVGPRVSRFTRLNADYVLSVQGTSAFMIDLQQISFALRNATARSLIIVDEFGKGTNSSDGAGLFWGVIEHLIRRGTHAPYDEQPRVVVATHFSHVLANELISPALPISYLHMEIVVQPTRRSNISRSSSSSSSGATSVVPELTYLYRIKKGLSPSSHAFSCALQFGISPETVARAVYVSHLVATFDLSELLNAELDDEERAELESSEAIGRRFLSLDLDDGAERGVEDWRRIVRQVLSGKEDEGDE